MVLPTVSRSKKLIKQLIKAEAFSADSAKTLEELGIFDKGAEYELLYDDVISANGNGGYYLNKH
ncbi:MAG: hypothetical protein K6G33_00285 [Ruminococcus sp.]|uniref:hypothetical protein n=1 Tax=Ruminococcus sp. TaxID=41978 RepID=UPI0025D98861|nr:hypothetical protein [Ruminococcus sp.]MCR5599170.1 hypothetical protein [Ruminococcus sp.]